MKNKFFLLFSLVLLASCSSRKEIVYFQDAEKLDNKEILMKFEPVIEVNDILSVDVSSLNDEVVEPFQMNSGNQQSGGGGSQSQAMQGYLVDIDGDIQFPVLGKIPVANKSRSELEAFLTNEIKAYVTDAVVAVRGEEVGPEGEQIAWFLARGTEPEKLMGEGRMAEAIARHLGTVRSPKSNTSAKPL